jgi:virulence-associated protein VapD
MTTISLRRVVLSRLAYAVLAAGLGAFIAVWVEPTWRGLVHGEQSYRLMKNAREGMVVMMSPTWAVTGAVVGLVLGLVGLRWQVRGLLLAAILGAGVGAVAGGAFAAAEAATNPPATRPAPNRNPYWDVYTRRIMAEGIGLGAWVGAVTGLLVGWFVRQPRTGATADGSSYPPFDALVSARPTAQGYALAIDLDAERRRVDAADQDLRRILQQHGFDRHQGDVHYGGESVTAVTCVLAAQDLARSLPWFAASARQVRMLRVGESDDLMPAVQRAVGGQS